MSKTNIEWVRNPDGSKGETWSVVTGCSPVSPGCRNCYAARMAATRLKHHPRYEGLAYIAAPGLPCWTGEVRLNHDVLDRYPRREQPLRWKKPRQIFVASMGDLFHENVPFRFVDKVMAVMALCPQHTFQLLTKRPVRMFEYFCDYPSVCDGGNVEAELTSNPDYLWEASELFGGIPERYCDVVGVDETQASSNYMVELDTVPIFPLSNVWLGVSVENPDYLWRIEELTKCPAAVHFASLEPLLGGIDVSPYLYHCSVVDMSAQDIVSDGDHTVIQGATVKDWFERPGLDWVIVGGESGPGARSMHLQWVRDVRDQCQAAGVSFFMKQLGGHPNKRATLEDMPLDLQIREFPENVHDDF